VSVLELRDFPGAGDPTRLLPAQSTENAPFWNALAQGHLMAQACAACARTRHPIAPVCPYCSAVEFAWRALRGSGILHSWARYHRSYLPEFEPLMPYVVLCVSLDDGPRMFGRLASGEPSIGMRVQAIVERFGGGGHALAFDG
jgi:hypothetical protein